MTDAQEKSAPVDRETMGPFDEVEVSGVRPYVDLGSIKLIPREGLNLRLEVEDGTGRVVAAALDFRGSTLQVQPFAAARNAGLWGEIRAQLSDQVIQQGGEVSEVSSVLGPELICRVPVSTPNGPGFQDVRFVGVDGPRWFLRGVIAGPAAVDAEQGAAMLELFRGIVVVRGQSPLPPKELLPLKVPAQASGSAQAR
ncbi:hypothetical protein GCM10027022_07420 [Alpinimonas psychrophila]|uniref:DUF3710 domain-containing protein n=1 Tax=Alpinimonas psychrophila TaxID=748908 RepID=A0A7W3JT11_9MICO|nr:DUF3710 domain-containing protein [Alpinimonas psychrophila]MBA8828562.1 hypothetical protein [Alpinimonas psychrophila]